MTETKSPGGRASSAESSAGSAYIEVKDLRKVFRRRGRPEVVAVDGLSFHCEAGEVVGLLGANGAGKTTTLRMLSTSLRPTSGEAWLGGVSLTVDPTEARRRIGFLSGATGLYGRLTPTELVTYFGRLYGMSRAEIDQRRRHLFSRLGLERIADRQIDRLSTGQRQRASIARTTIHDPLVIIFDEPTSGLDVLGAQEILELLEESKARGRAILFSTHSMAEATRLCDRIVIIHQGRKVAEGTSAELVERTGSDDLEEAFRQLVLGAEKAHVAESQE